VEFNSSVTLSQHHAILGKSCQGNRESLEKSEDETLKQLAQGYQVMEKESKHLAKLVEKQLQEYNREILNNSAILMDDWCSACLYWCDLLMSVVSCTIFDWLICTSVCASVTGPLAEVCPLLCGLVIAAVCWAGTPIYCSSICAQVGLC